MGSLCVSCRKKQQKQSIDHHVSHHKPPLSHNKTGFTIGFRFQFSLKPIQPPATPSTPVRTGTPPVRSPVENWCNTTIGWNIKIPKVFCKHHKLDYQYQTQKFIRKTCEKKHTAYVYGMPSIVFCMGDELWVYMICNPWVSHIQSYYAICVWHISG